MPYDQQAIQAIVNEMDIVLRSSHHDQLEAARTLLSLVRTLLKSPFEAKAVSAIVETAKKQWIEMPITHTHGRRVVDDAEGYLMVEFACTHDTTEWSLQWWWDGGAHAAHAAKQLLPLFYDPRDREFHGPTGEDAGVLLVRAIAQKMLAERT